MHGDYLGGSPALGGRSEGAIGRCTSAGHVWTFIRSGPRSGWTVVLMARTGLARQRRRERWLSRAGRGKLEVKEQLDPKDGPAKERGCDARCSSASWCVLPDSVPVARPVGHVGGLRLLRAAADGA